MRKDYTGIKLGRLTAVSDTGKNRRKMAVWLFRCDCGNLVERIATKVVQSVRDGYKPGCDVCISPRLNLAGQKFGKLTAIREVAQIHGNGALVWLFECECGKQIEKVGHYIVHLVEKGFIPSCGSYECNGRYKNPEASLNGLITHYKQGAKSRGLVFKLTREECIELFNGDCHYCGQPPSRQFHHVYRKSTPITYNGIDRVDNNLGYIARNTVSCCFTCNRAKHTMPYNQWIAWLHRIAERYSAK